MSLSNSLYSLFCKEFAFLFKRICKVYWILLKVMVPALVLVRALDSIGLSHYIAILISPLMDLVGLPSELGLVWAASLLVNIYTGMAVYFSLGLADPLSVAQITVLAALILVAHGLPVESAISKSAGLSWLYTLSLRFFGALLLGLILNLVFSHFSILQQDSQMIWQPDIVDDSLQAWVILQLQTLVFALLIIAALVFIMRLLEVLGIEKLIHWLLSPFLKILGIGKEAANITIIGVTLGLSFGGGLLVEQVQSGKISKRNVFLAMSFLSLSHSLIEDTMLMLLLGADLVSILIGRLIFTFIVIALIAHVLYKPKFQGSAKTD